MPEVALLNDKVSPLGDEYLFSTNARLVLFYARYNASLRNTDTTTHHITPEDIMVGLQRVVKDNNG